MDYLYGVPTAFLLIPPLPVGLFPAGTVCFHAAKSEIATAFSFFSLEYREKNGILLVLTGFPECHRNHLLHG